MDGVEFPCTRSQPSTRTDLWKDTGTPSTRPSSLRITPFKLGNGMALSQPQNLTLDCAAETMSHRFRRLRSSSRYPSRRSSAIRGSLQFALLLLIRTSKSCSFNVGHRVIFVNSSSFFSHKLPADNIKVGVRAPSSGARTVPMIFNPLSPRRCSGGICDK